MAYDWDVIVIGAGPAGLAAAIRVRWLKRYHCVPCSVMICDPSDPGGLLQLGSTAITGPSWSYEASEILSPLLKDIKNFQIPIVRDEIVSVQEDPKSDSKLLVQSRSGCTWRTLSVVIATGMKLLTNEKFFFGCGIEVTCISYQYVQERLREIFLKPDNFPLIFVGSGKLVDLMVLTEALRTTPWHNILYVVEEENGALLEQARLLAPGRVVNGRVNSYEGNEKLEYIRINDNIFSCKRVVIDFNSYELCPQQTVNFEPSLHRTVNGFIQVTRSMLTSEKGLYAAGDVTGMPASVAKSIGEGVLAGFSAYSYVYQLKFGIKPSLFAYVPDERCFDNVQKALPDAIHNMTPVLLVSEEDILPIIKEQVGNRATEVLNALNKRNKESFQRACGNKLLASKVLKYLVKNKLITVHAGAI